MSWRKPKPNSRSASQVKCSPTKKPPDWRLPPCDTQYKVDDLSPVTQLLQKARRRCLLDLVLDQSALAISVAMAGAILLLLTGTSLLEWYWIALLATASLALGLYRFRKR